jgi:N-acetylglucosaminyl-diphospho-decaprenol L-rhamnosyltransferase
MDMNTSRSPLLSVVIVTYNSLDMIRTCLDALQRATRLLPGCELIIIDNNSIDGTCELIRDTYKEAILIRNTENYGFAKAVNQGIKCSRGNYVLLLNSDAFLSSDSLVDMLTIMNSDGSIGVLSPQLVNPDGSWQKTIGYSRDKLNQISNIFFASFILSMLNLLKFNVFANNNIYSFVNVRRNYVSGACMLLRRSALDHVGLFDESFLFYSEDEDICARMRSGGYKVVLAPNIHVKHVRGGSTVSKEKYLTIYIESERIILRKYNYTDAQIKILYLSRALKSFLSYLILITLNVFYPKHNTIADIQKILFKNYFRNVL